MKPFVSPSQWTEVWSGTPMMGELAADMLREHGLDVLEQVDGDETIYVHPQDEPAARDIFKDWELE